MPSVPPTFVSFDSDDVLVRHACAVADIGDALSSSPTPDPELDDRMLVSVVTGDGVGAVTSSRALADKIAEHPMSLQSGLNLANLSLHSPSSIVGTPFDCSPRFEYPFPPSGSHDEPEIMMPSAFNAITSPFMIFPPTFTPMPPPMPAARGESRGHSPTHPKLQPRDPPVPPTLAKKRWSNTVSGPLLAHSPAHARKRSRSSSAGLKAGADGCDRPIAGASHERGSSVESAVQRGADGASTSRRPSRSQDTPKCRPGKEPEVIHSSLAGPRASSVKSKSLEGGLASAVHDVDRNAGPEPYPDLTPSGTAAHAQ